MWVRISTAINADPTATYMIFSLFCLGKGIGNVLTGSLSGGLVSSMVVIGSYGLTKYMAVVVFAGGCMALSAMTVCSWYMGRLTLLLI